MSDGTLKCPKCDGQMELGHTLDFAHGAVLVGHWKQGEPERTTLGRIFGSETITSQHLHLTIPIGSYRCQSCGYLESYAREEFRPK